MTDLHDVAPPAPPPLPPTPDHGDRRRRPLLALVAVVALAAGALGLALVLTDDDDDTVVPGTTATTEPTTAPSSATTEATTPTTAGPGATDTAVFPTSGPGLADPVEAARAFAVDIGFRAPVVGELQQGDSRSGEVEVRPTADGPVTTVFVRQLTADDTWYVLGSATANITLTEPEALAEIASPVRLRGTSTAFEANVNVEVHQDAAPVVIGTGFVMGGANGELGPFDGTVAFDVPESTHGMLLLRTLSMEDGSTWEAAAVRVRFADAGAETVTVQVFFSGDDPASPVVAYPRAVPRTTAVLRAALEQLLAGPTETEAAAGATSWFSTATAGMLVDVRLGDDGAAVVDFGDLPSVIPNASTSAGSHMLTAQLDATVFQFDSVRSVVYRLDGDCEAFTEWLQAGGCEPRPR